MSTEAMKLQEIMSQAQVFASAWSLVGGRFDGGNAMDEAEVAKNELHQMVAEALAAQPQQEPVAWMSDRAVGFKKSEFGATPTVPLYTSPPAQRKPQQEPVAWMHTNAIGHVYFRKNPQDKTLNPVPLYTSPPAQQQDFSDAYQGAREDLAIWKKRALAAEELNRKFIADINGQTFMGEPAQQEPVAWRVKWPAIGGGHKWLMVDRPLMEKEGFVNEALYTSPPAQEFVCSTGLCHYRKPLTDEEIETVWRSVQASDFHDCVKPFARAIEAKHNIKENT